MNRIVAGMAAVLAVAALPALGQAKHGHMASKTAPMHKGKKTVVKYKAQCGMIYSAADAKKYHYICPMDHKPMKKIVTTKSN